MGFRRAPIMPVSWAAIRLHFFFSTCVFFPLFSPLETHLVVFPGWSTSRILTPLVGMRCYPHKSGTCGKDRTSGTCSILASANPKLSKAYHLSLVSACSRQRSLHYQPIYADRLRSTFAVRETASLCIMGAPRLPPLNPSESIML